MASKDNLDVNHREFNNVSESYEVLSNPKLKLVYDKSGANGLRTGIKSSAK